MSICLIPCLEYHLGVIFCLKRLSWPWPEHICPDSSIAELVYGDLPMASNCCWAMAL